MAGLSEQEEFELLSLEREKAFSSTSGGAATGNPNLRRQGDKQIRNFGSLEPVIDIGGAAAVGGAMGYAAPEIATGIGRAVSAIPHPAARVAGGFFENAAPLLRAAGRGATALSGAISGGAGETAGQMVEAAGGPQVAAEAARFVVGGVGPESVNSAHYLLSTYVKKPALSFASHLKKQAAKEILGKLEGGNVTLSAKEAKFLDEITADLRGGERTSEPLERVGKAMDAYSAGQSQSAALGVDNATAALGGINRVAPVPPAEFADIGGALRDKITKRNEGMKAALSAQYTKNEALRNQIVEAKQKAGVLVESTPEFKALMDDLDLATGATKNARMQTPLDPIGDAGIKSNLNVIRNAVREKSVQVSEAEYNEAIAKGLKAHKGTDPQTGEPSWYRDFPTSFEALDNVRRKLGEVFRGQPAEGYQAITEAQARKYYSMISDVQKGYAGGVQETLLDDYARGKAGLEPFISARGRKATALDKYDEKQFANDASKLPEQFFSTRAGIKSLVELTGDPALVNRSAMQYINKRLEGASAAQADEFMRKNSEWLAEVPMARKAIENYASLRVVAERGLKQAQEFAQEVERGSAQLRGGRYPADRVRNLILNGDADLWAKAGPAIASSPQGKENILSAVRQTLADKPMDPVRFAERIRPALKEAGLADDAALDIIETKLWAIKDMKLPEKETLGLYRRVALQAMSGYAASGTARGAVEAAKMVPQ